MPACTLFCVTEVSLIDINLPYSHSPRRKTLPHSIYSMPRPAVQPATKLLDLPSVVVSANCGSGKLLEVPSAKLIVLVTELDTVRVTSIRPTARPPNIYGRKSPVAQPARPRNVISS